MHGSDHPQPCRGATGFGTHDVHPFGGAVVSKADYLGVCPLRTAAGLLREGRAGWLLRINAIVEMWRWSPIIGTHPRSLSSAGAAGNHVPFENASHLVLRTRGYNPCLIRAT